ncbi:ATP-binding cassette domain-containing protein [Candidatus Mycoplasma mahonii]|uniref:ATP-binding cassette domain-containing protein n=1 Tax=Candidatus Mycoplasma mahonii TaxID=3004105 RepID=UPI0026EB753A|nr:ATP-binding cassette domain-containing protein [Candidatus Mycoplasma mahonii]WKX02798.1 ATP-binding cassette domain-containing protein [Candidatus Mycoplasma mahonii]
MALIMRNISINYKNLKALDNVSIRFEDNAIIGLIGFNGSGKTTSFNLLTNLIENYSGNVLISEQKDGQEVERLMTRNDHYMFSYLSAGSEPQNNELVIDQLGYLGSLHGLSKKGTLAQIKEIIKVLEFDGKLNKPIKSLSKGNQQKIKLAGIFINPNIKYLLLDEPFDGLDPIMIEKIKNYILSIRKGLTIIITSHRMDVVDKMCDSFYILKDGVLVDSKVLDVNDKTIRMSVNLEVSLKNIKKTKYVLGATKNNKEIIIKVESLEKFKFVNKKLCLDPKYVWSSLKEKNLTESVFERYAHD